VLWPDGSGQMCRSGMIEHRAALTAGVEENDFFNSGPTASPDDLASSRDDAEGCSFQDYLGRIPSQIRSRLSTRRALDGSSRSPVVRDRPTP
jgi:hypothetical protein